MESNSIEKIELSEYEAVIENGLKTFVDVGEALLKIRDKKLYRFEFGTFEEYCKSRWNLKQASAYRFIDAYGVIENLKSSPIGELLPANESQARPLTRLEPDEQREAWKRVIEKAPPTGITAAIVLEAAKEIQQEKRDERRVERIEKLIEISSNNKPLEGIGKFPVLLCDPPWQYDFPISDSRRIENQYPTMSIDEICNLPVSEICTDDAIIFLWSPPSFIHKGLRVLSTWGFDFRTTMVWVKPSIGPGQWVRQRHELILIGVKGNIPTPRGEDKPDSVIEAPREEHSKKPDIVYDIIEKMYPELPKIELFCRKPRNGWAAWGNEI